MKRLLLGSAALMALALSTEAAEPSPQPNTKPVVAGNTQFAIDLYHQLRTKEGNLFYSPFSISTALAMTSAGARGQTLEQMTKVLHLPPQNALHPGLGAILKEANGSGRKRAYQLSTVNALWGQKGRPFRPDFLRLTRAHYQAGVKEVDFRKNTERARQTINAWAEKQTKGKIKGLVPPGVVTNGTTLVLTNAIYLKGDWESPFRPARTHSDDFHISARDKVRVPLMFQKHHFPYAEDRTVQVLSMPYKGNALDMVIVLPRKVDGLADVEKGLTAAKLNTWLKALRPREVKVTVPRFKITRGFRLKSHLEALGMTDAFDPGAANFTGIKRERGLFLQAVVHKAFVEVDEKGTEAAAGTAAAAGSWDGPERAVVKFQADHPFLFLIRDGRNDSILFVGRIVNPRGLSRALRKPNKARHAKANKERQADPQGTPPEPPLPSTRTTPRPSGGGSGGDDLGMDNSGNEEPEVPLQTVRCLRIVNRSAVALTVYLPMAPGARPQARQLEASAPMDLEVDDERMALSEIYIWGKSKRKAWSKYKKEPLVLVRRPYRSNNIGTLTFTFR